MGSGIGVFSLDKRDLRIQKGVVESSTQSQRGQSWSDCCFCLLMQELGSSKWSSSEGQTNQAERGASLWKALNEVFLYQKTYTNMKIQISSRTRQALRRKICCRMRKTHTRFRRYTRLKTIGVKECVCRGSIIYVYPVHTASSQCSWPLLDKEHQARWTLGLSQ